MGVTAIGEAHDEGDIAVVLFDLDDTLYAQETWLSGAWSAVAAEAATMGVDPVALQAALVVIAAEGSDRGRIIDRALDAIGADVPISRLLAAFSSHRPPRLEPFPGVRTALAQLGAVAGLGVVTDGAETEQEAKIDALGLRSFFDVVIVSDRLGREHRKPDPAPFRLALEYFALPPDRAVFVGDRPHKDTAGAQAVGMRAIRVATGEYAGDPDHPPAWRHVASVADAAAQILTVITANASRGSHRRPSPTG